MEKSFIKMLEDYPSMSDKEIEDTLLTRKAQTHDPADPLNRNLCTPEERLEIIGYWKRKIQWNTVDKSDREEIERMFEEFA